MIGETFASLSPAYIAAGTAVLLLVFQVWIRARYAVKVRAAGGVHAPAIARDPFTGSDDINLISLSLDYLVGRLTRGYSAYLALDNWSGTGTKPNARIVQRHLQLCHAGLPEPCGDKRDGWIPLFLYSRA
jgi:hypothetical protein